MDSTKEKWTELEHLPEWDEPYYQVYTAKKYGKWVMLKTLRPEYKGKPEYEDMIEKEFDTRYNMSHPSIVMINDFEEVPDLGRCIITDDVYGTSLRKLIDERKVTPEHIRQLTTRMIDALEYIQRNHIVHHPIRAERVIFTENIGNLKLIDVGFDQKNSLSPADTSTDTYNYGLLLKEALDACDTQYPRLRKVVAHCISTDRRKRYSSAIDLHQAITGRDIRKLYLSIIIFLALMVIIIGLISWLIPGGVSAR